VAAYFKRLTNAFHGALRNAKAAGHLDASVDPRVEADFFTASVLGMYVMLRAKAPASVIRNAAEVALQHLAGLRAEPRR